MSTWTAKAKAPGSDIRGLTSAASGIVKRRSAEITSCSTSAFGRVAAALHFSSRRSPSARRDRASDPAPSGPRRPPHEGSASGFVLPVFAAPRSRPRAAPLQGRSSCPASSSSPRRSSDRRSRRASRGRLAAAPHGRRTAPPRRDPAGGPGPAGRGRRRTRRSARQQYRSEL